MFHCLLRHYSKAKIFASSGGAHPPPALSSSLQPNGCVVVIYLPGPPVIMYYVLGELRPTWTYMIYVQRMQISFD